MKQGNKKNRIVLAILCGLLALACVCCACGAAALGRLLPSQFAAERWAGDSDQNYRQLSCFLSVDEPVTLNQIYAFRYAILDKLHEAGMDADTDTRLFRDAWSCSGKVYAATDLGHGEISAIAVGGDFFHFHPLRLLSGCYLSESDLMKDGVLLDEEAAWMLFGGVDLEGMELRINGLPFVVSGVVERESDFASQKAYQDGMGLYLSYDAYTQLQESAGATCYELVLAEPVRGFSLSFAREKFPVGRGLILENSDRFSFGRLFGLLGQFGQRSMQTHGVLYPYWENAARCLEDWAALLVLLALLFALFPAGMLLFLLVRALLRAKRRLSEELLPAWKEKAEDSLNRQQRKRWEKKHPGEH